AGTVHPAGARACRLRVVGIGVRGDRVAFGVLLLASPIRRDRASAVGRRTPVAARPAPARRLRGRTSDPRGRRIGTELVAPHTGRLPAGGGAGCGLGGGWGGG